MEIVEMVRGIDNHHQNNFFLPNELVIEILLRLRVESLLRFKTVCKYWFDVINGCDFVDNHFDHHSNHSRLLVYHVIPDPIAFGPFEALSIFPDETLAGEHPWHHYVDYPSMPYEVQRVIGPVKGIFWLPRIADESHKGYNGALLNPATREYRPLLVPYSHLHMKLWVSFQMYGFGFNPLTKDLKVVSLWCWDESHPNISPGGRPSVVVYSVANDSWKYLDLEHDPLNKNNCNKLYSAGTRYIYGTRYINGTCYWLLEHNKVYFLLSFDLTSDVLREIKGPEYNKYVLKTKLVVYNDSIAIFFYPLNWGELPEYIDLMVMKKEGCWTNDLTVDIGHLKMERAPLGFWKNNSIFLHAGDDMQLVLYDHTTHEIKELGIHKFNRGDLDSSPFIYKESLVSLKGGNMQHELYNRSTLQDIFTYRTHSLEGEENEDPNEEEEKKPGND